MSTTAAKELLYRLGRAIAAPQARLLLTEEVRLLLHDVGLHLVNAADDAQQLARRVEALEAWRSESLEKNPDGKN